MAEAILELLQAMVQTVLDGQREIRADRRDVNLRLGALEQGQATVIKQLGNQFTFNVLAHPCQAVRSR